jgi:hypothetical protein
VALGKAPPRSQGDAAEPPPRSDLGDVLRAIHLAHAAVLLDLAEAAATVRDDGRLDALLAAVLQLDPPPPIVPALRKLARHPRLSERARERIDFGMRLFKSADGREPTVDGLWQATELMRQVDPPPAVLDHARSTGV